MGTQRAVSRDHLHRALLLGGLTEEAMRGGGGLILSCREGWSCKLVGLLHLCIGTTSPAMRQRSPSSFCREPPWLCQSLTEVLLCAM